MNALINYAITFLMKKPDTSECNQGFTKLAHFQYTRHHECDENSLNDIFIIQNDLHTTFLSYIACS